MLNFVLCDDNQGILNKLEKMLRSILIQNNLLGEIASDDIYTSVGEISNQLDKLLSTDTAKYDLQGRPLNSPHKGQFYIQNGKAYLKE